MTLRLSRRYREITVAVALVLGALLALGTGGRVELVDGVLYDAALALVPRHDVPPPPRVVVVAIDQHSLSSPRLELTPRVFFGPHYAELVEGLFRAEAKAVGFDVILGFSASRFQAMNPAYDEKLMDALADHHERIVLARTVSTRIAEPYVAALFDPELDAGHDEPRAVAYSELVPSQDGVQRWIYPRLPAEGGTDLPTLAARLTEIAGGKVASAPFLLAPREPLERIPTYSLADVLSCIETDPAAVKAAFAGKVVLVGSNLTEEDRKRGPDRFLSWPGKPPAAFDRGVCTLHALGYSNEDGATIPGVHVHAAAVEAMLQGAGVTVVPMTVRVLVASLAAGGCATLALFLSPVIAVVALLAVLTVLFGASVVVLGGARWLPVAVPALAAASALLGGQLARFFYQERRRKRVERAFGHYLAPTVVAQLSDSEEEVKLGGETRDITVIFADLSGFTATSDTMGPAELMELTNRYFQVMVESIDAHGGYVDKFIGDSVMAIWGAPSTIADAPGRALDCCFDIMRRVKVLRESRAGIDPAGFDVKVGLASGPAIVGNVGSPSRLSYTALGATINLAARLEKVCSAFGCPIVVDEGTRNLVSSRFLFCELDAVPLRGKRDLVPVFEAIAPLASATPAEREYTARYEAALAAYRERRWESAREAWLALQASLGTARGTVAPKVMAEQVLAKAKQ